MDALDAVIPLVSLLIGSVITYWVNIRTRKQSYIDDLFNQAIAAVSAAEASIDWTASIAQPESMSNADYSTFQSWLVTEGVRNWATRQSEANLALARVVPYRADLEPLLPYQGDASHRGTHKTLIELLRLGPTG